ncbi:hypothetical protein SSS_02657 [Sarcoptes scabiei]|uniref:Uncharacterized protein n=1 Tax=Sarcoptes scabiei TaxID=52283 RepID=A0A834VCF1_SARSC|nr:hypothetical protein SSS_02657 [Sarcoptes scabiei]
MNFFGHHDLYRRRRHRRRQNLFANRSKRRLKQKSSSSFLESVKLVSIIEFLKFVGVGSGIGVSNQNNGNDGGAHRLPMHQKFLSNPNKATNNQQHYSHHRHHHHHHHHHHQSYLLQNSDDSFKVNSNLQQSPSKYNRINVHQPQTTSFETYRMPPSSIHFLYLRKKSRKLIYEMKIV